MLLDALIQCMVHACNACNIPTARSLSQCRKLMIDAVMATDMAIHFDLLKSFNAQVAATPNVKEWQERNLLYQMVVHLADIANPARPFHLARGWAERVISEFCDQVRQRLDAGNSRRRASLLTVHNPTLRVIRRLRLACLCRPFATEGP